MAKKKKAKPAKKALVKASKLKVVPTPVLGQWCITHGELGAILEYEGNPQLFASQGEATAELQKRTEAARVAQVTFEGKVVMLSKVWINSYNVLWDGTITAEMANKRDYISLKNAIADTRNSLKVELRDRTSEMKDKAAELKEAMNECAAATKDIAHFEKGLARYGL